MRHRIIISQTCYKSIALTVMTQREGALKAAAKKTSLAILHHLPAFSLSSRRRAVVMAPEALTSVTPMARKTIRNETKTINRCYRPPAR